MALIPENELQFLLENVDKVKPWERPEYKIEMFLRKYFCTLVSAFLAIAVLDPPFDYIFIGLAFLLEVTISWRAYDMKMSGADVVRLMYCVENPARTNKEYKKFLGVFALAYCVLFSLQMVVALNWEHMPMWVVQYPALIIIPALCFYSSLCMIRARTKQGILERVEMYDWIGNTLGGGGSPYIDGIFRLMPSVSLQRSSHSIFMISVYVFWAIGAFALSMFWPIWPGNMQLWGMIGAVGLPMGQILGGIIVIPRRAFFMKCFYIDEFRLNHFKKGKN